MTKYLILLALGLLGIAPLASAAPASQKPLFYTGTWEGTCITDTDKSQLAFSFNNNSYPVVELTFRENPTLALEIGKPQAFEHDPDKSTLSIAVINQEDSGDLTLTYLSSHFFNSTSFQSEAKYHFSLSNDHNTMKTRIFIATYEGGKADVSPESNCVLTRQ